MSAAAISTASLDDGNVISVQDAGKILGLDWAYVGMFVPAGILKETRRDDDGAAFVFRDEVTSLRDSGFKKPGITELMLLARKRQPEFPFLPGCEPTPELLACVAPELQPQLKQQGFIRRMLRAVRRAL